MGKKLSVVEAFIGQKGPQQNNLVHDNTLLSKKVLPSIAQREEKMKPEGSRKARKPRKSFYETNNRIQKSVWINKPLRREIVSIVGELNGRSLPFTEGQLLRESVQVGWPTIKSKYLKMLSILGDAEAENHQF